MAGLGPRFRAMNPRDRRAVVLGAGALVVVLLIVVVMKVAGGGGSGGGAGNTGVSAPITTPSPRPGSPGVTTPVAPGGGAAPSFPVYSQKDPFQPPPNAPGTTTVTTGPGGGSLPGGAGGGSTTVTTVPGTGGGTTGGGTSTSTTVAGTGGGGVSTTTTTTPGAGSGGSTAPARGQTVQLLDVYASGSQTEASVQVDDQVYTVSAGQSFATNYKVVDLSLASGCGDFTDQGNPFRLCKGQAVLK